MTKLKYRKFVLPEIVSGEGSLSLVAAYASRFSLKHLLLVSDEGVNKAGWVYEVESMLAKEGISSVRYLDATPNPKDHEVMRGAKLYSEERCDGIAAVGGGSAMDCAKGIAIVVSNGGYINDYEGIDTVPLHLPPMIFIPTTSGSAADVSQFAIITNVEEKRKIAIVSKSIVPDVSLVDPLLTLTMPSELTSATGVDALVHAFEAYLSTASSPFTDMYALEAVKLIVKYLPLVMKEPQNPEFRARLSEGSTFAGAAFSNASLGLVHAMAHSLGGLFDSPHGECNALLLESVVRFNFSSSPDRYRVLAGLLGVDTALPDDALVENISTTIRNFRKSLGISATLSALGVTAEIIPLLAAHAFDDPCVATNPRIPTRDQIGELYEESL